MGISAAKQLKQSLLCEPAPIPGMYITEDFNAVRYRDDHTPMFITILEPACSPVNMNSERKRADLMALGRLRQKVSLEFKAFLV